VNGDDTVPASDLAPNGLDIPRQSVEPSINDTGTDRDELDESRMSPSTDDDVEMSDITSDVASGSRVNGKSAKITGPAARQKALAEKKRIDDAQTAARQLQITQQREDDKAKKAVGKSQLAEKKRLADEREATRLRLEELEREFRAQMSKLRTGPIGQDRFGNKYWWMDGTGGAPLVDKEGNILYGTGRIYMQGGSPEDLERRLQEYEFTEQEIRQKRLDAEGEDGILEEGEWAMIDAPEQVSEINILGWNDRDR
jgi:bromodomain adjacent to zinc finger domain protein 1A